MRRAALFAGLAALVVGSALALRPFHQSFDMHAQGLTPQLVGVSDCGVPLAASFARQADAGWFAYAPETEVDFAGRFGCRSAARWRVAAGVAIITVGLGFVLFAAAPKLRSRRSP